MDVLYWTIPFKIFKWMMTGGTPIHGTPPSAKHRFFPEPSKNAPLALTSSGVRPSTCRITTTQWLWSPWKRRWKPLPTASFGKGQSIGFVGNILTRNHSFSCKKSLKPIYVKIFATKKTCMIDYVCFHSKVLLFACAPQ